MPIRLKEAGNKVWQTIEVPEVDPLLAPLVYAVLEGVAFAFADGVDVLAEAGARPIRPLLVGGGARSRYWGQLVADATGLSIDLAEGAEAGAAASLVPLVSNTSFQLSSTFLRSLKYC